MKPLRFLAAVTLLFTVILLCCVASASKPILPATEPRAPEKIAYLQGTELAEKYGLSAENWPPRYTPASLQPMNAYIVTDPECWVGINQDGRYLVSEKGLVYSITKYLQTWAENIMEASEGAIRFVEDPDNADILVAAKMTYSYAGKYSGGGLTVSGYSTTVQLTAWRLTDPEVQALMSITRSPGQTVSISGSGNFWMNPPQLPDTEELKAFVGTILSWYGYGSEFDDIAAMVDYYYPVIEDEAASLN